MTDAAIEAVPTSRRQLLIGLAMLAPAVSALTASVAAVGGGDGAFMQASRIITGNDRLSPEIGSRIEALLAGRIRGFASRLDALAGALARPGGTRDTLLAGLTDDQVTTAIEIAKPWYLGWVGTPSATILKDDAVFATFLEAQSFDKIVDVVPLPTYPRENAGWWGGAPPGVAAPAMPADILSWTFQATDAIHPRAPDPRWRSYAAAQFASIDDARKAKP